MTARCSGVTLAFGPVRPSRAANGLVNGAGAACCGGGGAAGAAAGAFWRGREFGVGVCARAGRATAVSSAPIKSLRPMAIPISACAPKAAVSLAAGYGYFAALLTGLIAVNPLAPDSQ